MIAVDETAWKSLLGRRFDDRAESHSSRELRALLARRANLVLPGHSLQVLLTGIRQPQMGRALSRALEEIPLLAPRRADFQLAARLADQFDARPADALIVAQTLRAGARLFTLHPRRRHMARQLGIEVLPFLTPLSEDPRHRVTTAGAHPPERARSA